MEKKQGFFEKLRAGLKKTRDNWFDSLFGEDRITEEFYEELEEAMILADMGAATASELIEALKEQVKTRKLKTCADTKQALIELIAGRVETGAPFVPDTAPAALLIVGVNGVGKTTSIGKIAHDYAERGRRPMLAAADTFRAAAAEQLGDWAQRAGVPWCAIRRAPTRRRWSMTPLPPIRQKAAICSSWIPPGGCITKRI